MIFISILTLIVAKALPSLNIKLSPVYFTRISAIIFLYAGALSFNTLYIQSIGSGIGIYSGLFHITGITQIFHIFIFIISAAILQFTGFYPRKVWLKKYSSFNRLLFYNFIYYRSKIINKTGEQFKIIEYHLIMLFIITGSVFLISTSDLVSIFLSIELQSYGLYLLSTLYRNSELATTGGLTYFLLGGLSSCFILLGTSLLYSNSGLTNLDGLYILTSLSDIGNNYSILY